MPSLTEDQWHALSQDQWEVWYEASTHEGWDYTAEQLAYVKRISIAITTFGNRS